MLEGFNNKNPFSVPDGYFEDVETKMQQRICEAELAALKKDVFTVPQGYFADALERNTAVCRGKRDNPLFISKRLMRYAAALLLAGTAAVGLGRLGTDMPDNTTAARQGAYKTNDTGNSKINITATEAASSKEVETYLINNYTQSELLAEL